MSVALSGVDICSGHNFVASLDCVSLLGLIKVRHGCDSTCWGPGPSGCQQTLLHRAIDENNEVSACFLIRRSVSLCQELYVKNHLSFFKLRLLTRLCLYVCVCA